MTRFFEVWDDATANRLGEFETIDEARALLATLLRESGADAVRNLAVLSYSAMGTSSDDYAVTTVLEGADLVAQQPTQATRSIP